MREKIFYSEKEAYEYRDNNCPATGMVLEGCCTDGTPYWKVIC